MPLAHPEVSDLTRLIIGHAIEVHRELGPGLLESVYEECLAVELSGAGHSVGRQQVLPVVYKGKQTSCVFRPDVVIDHAVIVEIKHVEKLLPVHSAQINTYLKLSKLPVGLLFNFNTTVLINGIVRISL